MRRREFIAALGGAAVWPVVAGAQQKLFHLGVLSAGGDPFPEPFWAAFAEAFRGLGWIEGKNFAYELRYADNRLDRLPDLTAELVGTSIDLIVTIGTLAPLAAKRATAAVPIVMTSAGDPLGSGLVKSLARPGGNVTSLSLMAPDLAGKSLQIVKELLPSVSRVGVLWNAANPYPALVFKQTQDASRDLAIEIRSLEVRGPAGFHTAFETAMQQRADALVIVGDPLTVDHRALIADFATKSRLPTMFGGRDFVLAGGLMSYGTDIPDLFRRSAGYVDKILKGEKPADMPVEQPTKFEFIINLKTAKALSLTVPPTLLARTDEVIE
jgi:putative ABC transport system substrate-binding protein